MSPAVTLETNASEMPRVAFCGLGRMGVPMARRVAEAGFPLTVWNLDKAPADEFARATGARVAESPADAARGADIVVTMLINAQVVLSVMQSPNGLLAGLRPGAILVDCSTIGADAAAQVRALCETSDVGFVSSPVSGSTALAGEGQLALMVGGDAKSVAAVEPLLSTFAKSVNQMGTPEAAAATKVAVNALLHTFNAGLAEIVVVTEKAGVDRRLLFDALANSVLANPYLAYKRANYENPDQASVAFDLQTALKDIGLAADAAVSAGLVEPLIATVGQIHKAACEAGFGQRDMAALAEFFDQAASDAAAQA